jgi:hypothetical protein
MPNTIAAPYVPQAGDHVEVWEDGRLECRGVAEEWSAPDPRRPSFACGTGTWRVRDEVTGSMFDIPERYLIKAREDN